MCSPHKVAFVPETGLRSHSLNSQEPTDLLTLPLGCVFSSLTPPVNVLSVSETLFQCPLRPGLCR